MQERQSVYFLYSLDINLDNSCICIYSVFFLRLLTIEGDLTDQASCPRSTGSDPQTVVSDAVVVTSTAVGKTAARLSPNSPTSRHNPFNEDSDTNTSADVTPVHAASRRNTTEDETEVNGNELEVIRYQMF